MTKLEKPDLCPKCNHENISTGTDLEWPMFDYVRCDHCRIRLEGNGIDNLIKEWNNRPTKDDKMVKIPLMDLIHLVLNDENSLSCSACSVEHNGECIGDGNKGEACMRAATIHIKNAYKA